MYSLSMKDQLKHENYEITINLKISLGYDIGWSREQILWSPKCFSESDLLMYQPSSYRRTHFNIVVIIMWRLKKASHLEILKLPRF